MVIAVHAPDSDKDLEQYEACVSCVLRVLRETRKEGAKSSSFSGDLNVELGMMCTDREDAEDLAEIYRPLFWHGHQEDPGGHNKLWYSTMKEFKCKVSSTWNDGMQKGEAFTHRQNGD